MKTDLLHIINKYGVIVLLVLMAFFMFRWGVSVGTNKSVAYTLKINRKRLKTLNDSVKVLKKQNNELLTEIKILNLDADEKTKLINNELNEVIKNINSINVTDDKLKKLLAKYERFNTGFD